MGTQSKSDVNWIQQQNMFKTATYFGLNMIMNLFQNTVNVVKTPSINWYKTNCVIQKHIDCNSIATCL